MTIGEKIKSLREANKVTQTELAKAIGTSKQNIYKYENGIITNIPSDKIESIAKFFNVSPGEIMGWISESDAMSAAFRDMYTKKYGDTFTQMYVNEPSDKTEREVKLIARKTKDLPEKDREALLELLNSTVDTFLKAKGIKND